MAQRTYLVPKAGDGTPLFNPWRPKYMFEMGVGFTSSDYGREPSYLVRAEVTPAQHASLIANADVVAFPLDMTQTIGANLATVVSALDAFSLPSQWVTSGMTYRQVARGICLIHAIVKRYGCVYLTRIFSLSITLSTTVGELSSTVQDRLRNVADQMGVSYAGVTGSTTIRQLLRGLAIQLNEDAYCSKVVP